MIVGPFDRIKTSDTLNILVDMLTIVFWGYFVSAYCGVLVGSYEGCGKLGEVWL